ncbi:MAG: transposase, partial [bacterium]|nr:transposase [bacterium]
RGTDGRDITLDKYDSDRFIQSLIVFNTQEPIGSIYQASFKKPSLSNPITKSEHPLVDIVSFCLNPNHYHLLLSPLVEGGVSKFMQKLGIGFTRYFNEKHGRNGVLFQGKFKARHIESDHDLIRMSAYINLNYKVHSLSNPITKLVRSSWGEYTRGESGICSKNIVLGQFNNSRSYQKEAQKVVRDIVKERAKVDKSNDSKVKKKFYDCYFD